MAGVHLLCCTASSLVQKSRDHSLSRVAAACLQLMAELSFKRLRWRSEAAGALRALLSAQLRQVGQGTPSGVVPARPAATRMEVTGPCSQQHMGGELVSIALFARSAGFGAVHTCKGCKVCSAHLRNCSGLSEDAP